MHDEAESPSYLTHFAGAARSSRVDVARRGLGELARVAVHPPVTGARAFPPYFVLVAPSGA
jgi:hypothetical protein